MQKAEYKWIGIWIKSLMMVNISTMSSIESDIFELVWKCHFRGPIFWCRILILWYPRVILIRFSDHPYTYLSNTVMVCNKRMPIPYLCWKVYKKIILMSQAFQRKLFFTTSLQTQLSSWRPFFLYNKGLRKLFMAQCMA